MKRKWLARYKVFVFGILPLQLAFRACCRDCCPAAYPGEPFILYKNLNYYHTFAHSQPFRDINGSAARPIV